MDFVNMLSPWQWGLLAAVPAGIVALYFLKLKRRPLEVPSTYLWHKSIEDLRVNSLWQRLRQGLLLFLQLLLVGLAALALLRPGWSGGELVGDRFIFLVDVSASMGATDAADGHSRLDEVKRRAGELVDAMKSGDAAQIITFSDADGARVEQPFTQSRRDLRRALDGIRPTSRTTSLEPALRLAAGLANPGRVGARSGGDIAVAEALPAELFILSDGKFPDVRGFSLGNLTPTFVPVGSPSVANVGIVALSVRRNEDKPEQLQAFGQLQNSGPTEVNTDVELFHNEQLIDARRVHLDKGASAGVAFDLGALDSGVLRLHVALADALAADNEAYAVLNRPRRARVLLVTAGNEPLRKALSTDAAARLAEITVQSPTALATPEYQQAAANGAYDLIIYDSCQPAQMPQANTLFIGRLPPVAGWSSKPAVHLPQIIDTDRRHPMTQSLELADVIIDEATPLEPPPGATRLVDSTQGVLLAIAPREGFEDAVLGFDMFTTDNQGHAAANTNWSIKLSFSLFAYQALSYLGGGDNGDLSVSFRPGQPVTLRPETPIDRLTVRTPGGREIEVPRDKGGRFTYTATDDLGVYDVSEGGVVRQQFAVNLCSTAESDIRPRETNTIEIGYTPVPGQSHWQPVRREAWRCLVLAALGVLLLEWYIYNRRVYL